MYADNLSIKAKELKREKKKSDTLLFQMLPLSVATQLKQTRKVHESANKKYELTIICTHIHLCLFTVGTCGIL